MSVLSIIKRGRQQAKEQKEKVVEKTKDEAVKLPYKHVPTHAAVDAMSGAPSSWRHEDRPKIMEQNRIRSAMTTTRVGLNGMPRVSSSLSYVSYPSTQATHVVPVVPVPKNHSFSGMPASWNDKSVSYSQPGVNYSQMDYFSYPGSGKGKEPETGKSSAMSSKDASRVVSFEKYSISDDFQIRPYRHSVTAPKAESTTKRPAVSRHISTSSENSHRLHPAHQRRLSEIQANTMDRHIQPATRSTSTHFTSSRPVNPETIAKNGAIPPVPALPALDFDPVSVSASVASSIASIDRAASTAPSSVASTSATSATATISSIRKETAGSNLGIASSGPVITDTFENGSIPSTQAPTVMTRLASKIKRVGDEETTYVYEESVIHGLPKLDATVSAATIRRRDSKKQAVGTSPVSSAPNVSRRLSKSPETKLSKDSKKDRWPFRSNQIPVGIAV